MGKIFAIGGGSFQKEEYHWMEEMALASCGKENISVLFLPCASYDDQGYGKRMKKHLRKMGCSVEVLRLFHTKKAIQEIHMMMKEADVIYLGAGNMKVLKDKLIEIQADEILKELFFKENKILIGNSAGANVFFSYAYSDWKEDGSLCIEEGFHLVKGIFNPHAQDEKRKGILEAAKPYDLSVYNCKDNGMLVIEDTGKISAYLEGKEISLESLYFLEK